MEDVNTSLNQFYISSSNIYYQIEGIKLILDENDTISDSLRTKIQLSLDVCYSEYNSLKKCLDTIISIVKYDYRWSEQYIGILNRFSRISDSLIVIQDKWSRKIELMDSSFDGTTKSDSHGHPHLGIPNMMSIPTYECDDEDEVSIIVDTGFYSVKPTMIESSKRKINIKWCFIICCTVVFIILFIVLLVVFFGKKAPKTSLTIFDVI